MSRLSSAWPVNRLSLLARAPSRLWIMGFFGKDSGTSWLSMWLSKVKTFREFSTSVSGVRLRVLIFRLSPGWNLKKCHRLTWSEAYFLKKDHTTQHFWTVREWPTHKPEFVGSISPQSPSQKHVSVSSSLPSPTSLSKVLFVLHHLGHNRRTEDIHPQSPLL